jgi:hypothetical protein
MSDFLFPAEAFEVVQVGFEAADAPGVIVPATRRFFGFTKFDVDFKPPTMPIHQAGNLHPVGSVTGKGHSEGSAQGEPTVEDLIVVFASMFGTPTFAGSISTFAPQPRTATPFTTLSIEKGQFGSGTGSSYGYGVFQECEMDFVPDKSVNVTAKLLCQNVTTDFTLTDGVTTLGSSILEPTKIDVFVALTEDALLDTQIVPLSAKFKASKTKGDVYTLDSRDPSYTALVYTMPDLTFELVMPKGTTSNSYLNSIVNSTVFYMEVQARSAVLAGDGNPSSVTIRAPFYFTNPNEGMNQDVHTQTYTGSIAHVDTFSSTADGGALLITCNSTLDSLA